MFTVPGCTVQVPLNMMTSRLHFQATPSSRLLNGRCLIKGENNIYDMELKGSPEYDFMRTVGSEYRTSLVFDWSKVVQSPNGPLFECHLNTGLNLVRYSDHHLNTELPFYYRTSEYQTRESLLFLCLRNSDVQYSDPHCIC